MIAEQESTRGHHLRVMESHRMAIVAYDGSSVAARAIEEAARRLTPSIEALVVCVWRPCDVGFRPVGGRPLRTAVGPEVRRAAEETAAHGAFLAERAGLRARSRAVRAAPTWRGLLDAAEENECRLIVIGSHRRRGLIGRMAGSVAHSAAAHFDGQVLILGGQSH